MLKLKSFKIQTFKFSFKYTLTHTHTHIITMALDYVQLQVVNACLVWDQQAMTFLSLLSLCALSRKEHEIKNSF
jgi:hypothetical protein